MTDRFYRPHGGPMCVCRHQWLWHGDNYCGATDLFGRPCQCPGFERADEGEELHA